MIERLLTTPHPPYSIENTSMVGEQPEGLPIVLDAIIESMKDNIRSGVKDEMITGFKCLFNFGF